ncbi:hypothetical protein DM02DRAFT_606803, partial [Periconia macrospinosa]
MEITRDRSHRQIFLSQSSYIDKIAKLIDRQDLRHDTPMTAIELKPNEKLAPYADANRYQRKIGSLLFAAVTTRPDIA